MSGGVHEKMRKSMKIVIERKQSNIMVDVVAPEEFSALILQRH